MLQWGMLQRTVLINNIRMLQRTQTLQRTRRNTIGRCYMRVHMTCRAFPLWLERQSLSLLSFVRFSYHFSSVFCLFASLAGKDCLCFSCALNCLCFLLGNVCAEFSLRKNCLCFSYLHVQCIKVKLINFILFYTYFLILFYIFLV